MCLNPKFILGYKFLHKGYEKTILFFGTTYDEYCRGFVSLSDIVKSKRLSFKLSDQLFKYGLDVTKNIIFNIRFEIPCRTCLYCTRQRASEWSIRCHLESLAYSHNYFVTLSYNNNSLPRNFYKVYDDSSNSFITKSVPTLSKKHSIQFMKSLRTVFSRDYSHDGIRFFMCGEYGTKTLRPHYHFILFNLPLDDLKFFGFSKKGFPLYRSKTIERVWPYGFVTVQPYSIETARYTAQYCCKKLNKASAFSLHKEMEYINMSRRPGIGTSHFLANVDSLYTPDKGFSLSDYYNFVFSKNGKINKLKFSIPKAFTRLFKPITDSSRGLDTEHGSLRCLLNSDGDFIFDIIQRRNLEKSVFAENLLKTKMNNLGFDYDKDRYSFKYLDYLDIVKSDYLKKFKVMRNLS